ncbi:unnamed protein product [Oncorhynchus mykiss]|uniref:Uncharacterized protein n=1 Tax=Oncorhynchus mykiss TaxID=8022 RepID=A0A060YN81_ONCMY|nr:unnamed protein product [Oncorhynchus mykiss]
MLSLAGPSFILVAKPTGSRSSTSLCQVKPRPLSSLVTIAAPTRSTRISLVTLLANSSFGRLSFQFSAANDWNELQKSLKLKTHISLTSFKHQLSEQLTDHCTCKKPIKLSHPHTVFILLLCTPATVFLETFNAADIFWYASPDLCRDAILSRNTTDNSFDLCSDVHCQLWAFPNHVQSIEFTTSGIQSSCRNISRMINGNRMYLVSISSLIKGSEYVKYKILHLQNFQITCFRSVIMLYCV